jgi:AmmeMemoRadiSam system protein B
MWGRSERKKMLGKRPSAVAGLFYPGEAGALRRDVDAFLARAGEDVRDQEAPVVPKAVVAPHAGYPYSGPVAGSAFEPFRPLAGKVERVVVVGPSHHVPLDGIALPDAECFDSPLGPVELDLEACQGLLDEPVVRIDGLPHHREHSLEVELPFLQQVLGPFRLVPLVVGRATPEDVAAVLDKVWGDDATRVVVSSDLSHFLDYGAARRKDEATVRKILDLDVDVTARQACGAAAINGFNLLAARRGLTARLLDLRNSGDTAGGHDRVVGYGAFVYSE